MNETKRGRFGLNRSSHLSQSVSACACSVNYTVTYSLDLVNKRVEARTAYFQFSSFQASFATRTCATCNRTLKGAEINLVP